MFEAAWNKQVHIYDAASLLAWNIFLGETNSGETNTPQLIQGKNKTKLQRGLTFFVVGEVTFFRQKGLRKRRSRCSLNLNISAKSKQVFAAPLLSVLEH